MLTVSFCILQAIRNCAYRRTSIYNGNKANSRLVYMKNMRPWTTLSSDHRKGEGESTYVTCKHTSTCYMLPSNQTTHFRCHSRQLLHLQFLVACLQWVFAYCKQSETVHIEGLVGTRDWLVYKKNMNHTIIRSQQRENLLMLLYAHTHTTTRYMLPSNLAYWHCHCIAGYKDHVLQAVLITQWQWSHGGNGGWYSPVKLPELCRPNN